MAGASAVVFQILYAVAAILSYIAVQKFIEQRKQKSGGKLQHQRDRQKEQQPEVQYRGDSATDSVGASPEHAQLKGSAAKSYAQLLQPTLPESVFTPEPSMLELPFLPCDWEITPEQMVILKRPDGSPWELGTGAFGKVFKGVLDGVQTVAVKQLLEQNAYQQQKFVNEIAILRSCRNENIVCFLGVMMQPESMSLIMEYVPHGNLFKSIQQDSKGTLQWWDRGRHVALDIAKGLAYLHSRKIIHLDLKSHNILLGRGGVAKIADVGLAKIMSNSATRASAAGTFDWAAPEQLVGEKCTEKADIYSLGVVLWELCTLDTPMLRQTRDIMVPEECPQEIANLIQQCKLVDPKQRPSAREVFEVLKRNCLVKRPLPGAKMLSKSTSAGSAEGTRPRTPTPLPSMLNQGADIQAPHPVQSPFGAGSPPLSYPPHPTQADPPPTDLPIRHQGPALRGSRLAEGGAGAVGSGSLLSPSGRESSYTFTSHSGSDSGRAWQHAEDMKKKIVSNAMCSWAEAVALSAGEEIDFDRTSCSLATVEAFVQLRQKYAFQVKRRLVDEAQLPDSTAHLENMVSAFRQFMSLVGQYDMGLFTTIFSLLFVPVPGFTLGAFDCLQGEVTENQREMIAANWGKLNLSRQGVAHAKQTMIAALNAASEGANLYQLSDRAASTSLAAEKIKAALAEESVSAWHFMMGWMTVFNTRQVASWQLEVATGLKCIVCRTVEDMERHPHCWQQQHKAKQHAKVQRHGAVARLTGRTSGYSTERRPRRRDKIYSALWHLVPPVPSFE
ncbi:hypothetical protein ABBQ32_005555 [Trebouxia sp. C0010 RCD-2024]